jgi:hypothetical protein
LDAKYVKGILVFLPHRFNRDISWGDSIAAWMEVSIPERDSGKFREVGNDFCNRNQA